MSIKRVSVLPSERSVAALLVETSRGSTIEIAHSEKGDFVGGDDDATEVLLKAEMVRRAPVLDKSDLGNIWIHINRNPGRRQGKLVIATGDSPPPAWPEDETDKGSEQI